MRLLASPNISSRRAVYRQYDHQVGNDTVTGPGGDAALVRVRGSGALALTTDGNGRYCALDPRLGAKIALCEAARNVVAVGATPIGVTNCLNFANPERPDVYWQLREAIEGLAEACEALGVPVVSGNVSLYNDTSGVGIIPTPVIGMVGHLEDLERRVVSGFVAPGDDVMVAGAAGRAGARWQRVPTGRVRPPVRIAAAARLGPGVAPPGLRTRGREIRPAALGP